MGWCGGVCLCTVGLGVASRSDGSGLVCLEFKILIDPMLCFIFDLVFSNFSIGL